MPRIFISYRRADSEHIAGRIDDRLAGYFGRDSVFIDIDTIPFGVDFRTHLQEAVAQCDLLLAIIGEHWTDIRHADGPQAGQRRLDDPEDFVRIEVQSALQRGISVIPVLVGRGEMPSAGELPDGLKELAYRNAAEVRSGRDFHEHVNRLIRGIETLTQQDAARREQAELARRELKRGQAEARREQEQAQAEERREQARQEADRLRRDAEIRQQEEARRLREQEEAEGRRREAERQLRLEAEKQQRERELARQREERELELARLRQAGEEQLPRRVTEIMNRTGGTPAAADEAELQRFCGEFHLSGERAGQIITAARDQWRLARQREEEAEALRRREQARRRQELAGAQAENLRRLQADGRLKSWVEARLAGWDRSDWTGLLRDLEQAGFFPLSDPELRLLVNSMQRALTTACLDGADARLRAGLCSGLAGPALALPIRGVWCSRESSLDGADWQFEASLPGVVTVGSGRECLLGVAPDVEDADLAPLSGLREVAELRALQLAWSGQITDAGLAHVRHLTQLNSLEIHIGDRVTSAGLAALGELTRLRSLVLHHCFTLQDSGIQALQPLRSLESLTLGHARGLTDAAISELGALDHLRSLGLWGCQKLTNTGLFGLVTLPELTSLTIQHCPEITVMGIAGLRGLKSLRELNVYRCCQIATSDLPPLQRELPQCRVTIVSAPRIDRLTELRQPRLAQLCEKMAARRAKPLPPMPSDTKKRVAQPPGPPPPPQVPLRDSGSDPEAPASQKKWWEIWK